MAIQIAAPMAAVAPMWPATNTTSQRQVPSQRSAGASTNRKSAAQGSSSEASSSQNALRIRTSRFSDVS